MNINIRLLESNDLDEYWEIGFEKPDKEMFYYTGTTHYPTKEEIKKFIDESSNDLNRKHFLICNTEDKIIGEIVLMDIDYEYKSCMYRIAIFNSSNFNKGIGSKATKKVLEFAFEKLNLHRVELEVFDYNPRAKSMYEKIGFKLEGIKRDAILINQQFHNVYIMSILRDEFIDESYYM